MLNMMRMFGSAISGPLRYEPFAQTDVASKYGLVHSTRSNAVHERPAMGPPEKFQVPPPV